MPSAQHIEVFKGLFVNLQAAGAVPDCRVLTDMAITATDTTLTSATAPFGPGDVGKVVCVNGAGVAGAALVTTIASFTDAGTVELAAAAATTVASENGVFGTDNAAAFAAFLTVCATANRRYLIPAGWYLTTQTVAFVDAFIEIEGDARDNVASSVIVYVGTGTAVSVYPTDLGSQCFACNIKNLAIVCYGGATDGLKLRNLSQSNFDNIGINQADGAASTVGFNLINPNILTFKGTIAQECGTAILIDSTGFPWDATQLVFHGGNLYQNTTAFDIRANLVSLTIQNMHIERFTTLLNLDKNNANLQVERLVFEDNEVLAGGGSFADATLVNAVAPGITTMKLRGVEFSRNRCYFITAKENPIKFDVSATGTADINFRLRDNVFSTITTSLISTASSPTGIEITAEGNLKMFGSDFTLMAAGYNAKVYVPIYGGDALTTANRVPFVSEAQKLNADAGLTYYGTAGSKTLEVASDNSTDGQLRVGDSAATRVLKLAVPNATDATYTAILDFLGALSAVAINGLVTIGSSEQPTVTLFVHNAATGGHTQIQVKGNAADGSGNAILNVLTSAAAAAFQVTGDGAVYLPLLTGSRPMRTGATGQATTGATSLTSANDVDVSGLTDGALVKRSGTVLASVSAFTANRVLIADGTGAIAVLSAMTASLPMMTAGDGLPTTTSWGNVYTNIKTDIDADFVSNTDLATNVYTKSEIDTMLAGYATTAALASKSDMGHNHGYSGTTGVTSGHDHSYSGTAT